MQRKAVGDPSKKDEETDGKKPKQEKPKLAKKPNGNTFEDIFGFRWQQLGSWNSFVQLMCRPCHPASLGITRIAFGLLMAMDTFNERGFQDIKARLSNDMCFYPLFDFIQPVQDVHLWCLLFVIMFLGTVGMAFGLFYRLSCLAFVVPYWYRYSLVTETWNNHSYLFGLIGTMLLLTDGHHFWSLDMLYRPSLRNAHVPLWNYAILRIQIFIVYFIAGLKKTDPDWLLGYSMHTLSNHWIFAPFKFIFGENLVDHVMIHVFGFLLDLLLCYFLYFDFTRPMAMFFGASFHIMNSQLFSIGMFPYTMLATLPIFCYPDWPTTVIPSVVKFIKELIGIQSKGPDRKEANCSANLLLSTDDKGLRHHKHCLYTDSKTTNKKNSKKIPLGRYHQMACFYLLAYAAIQGFLPFSHFITKGYNHWRNGLYGYSWDMMIHNDLTLHRRIFAHFPDNGTTVLVDEPNLSMRNRWTSYGRLAKQMARCLESRLRKRDINAQRIEIHIDIWSSLNERILQRVFDPRVDVLTAEWSIFKSTPWTLPLINDSEVWRKKAEQISEEYNASPGVMASFMTDFPGLTLENCVQPELINVTVEILEGESILEIFGQPNVTLKTGDTGNLKTGHLYKLHAISPIPTTYFFVATNETVKNKAENISVEVKPELNSEDATISLELCKRRGMIFDFAFEGDVMREREEMQVLSKNVSFIDSYYEVIRRHIESAAFNFNATKNALDYFKSKLM